MTLAKGPISILNDPLAVGARRLRLEPTGQYETWGRPLHGGTFAAMLWSRNESCLANDDTNVHLDPTPQVFWRSLGFKGEAEPVKETLRTENLLEGTDGVASPHPD